MKTWLVTGGCGFIGSTLADALVARGDTVRILDDLSSGRVENIPREAQLIVGSAADADTVAASMAGVDGVFHLAAQVSVPRCADDWLGSHIANLVATIAVLDHARRERTPVVYASSAAVYGDAAEPPHAERSATRPLSPYGADKLGGELHATVARATFGVPTLGLRFFNVYGPRQDGASPYSGVVSTFMERLNSGRTLPINGDGEQTRDLVFVGDVVRSLLAGMAALPDTPPVLNVCTGRAIRIIDLARTMARVMGRDPRIEFMPARAGDIHDSRGDPTLMRASLNVSMDTPLAAGLRMTLSDQRLAA